MEDELKIFEKELKQKTPDEILEKAYQLVVKILIIGEMSEKNLDYFELKELIKHNDLLAELYEDWRKSDLSLGENISYEMDNSITRIIDKAIKERAKKIRDSR